MDKSQHVMEAVILEATDDLRTWHEVSRKAYRFHHTVGAYGSSARTRDGRFLRFVWSCYCFDGSLEPNEILEASSDNGKTWENTGAFHDSHFASHAHRLRELRDGTLVLCLPMVPRWRTPQRPSRHCRNLNALSECPMTLWHSFDQGRTWQGPLPIYAGQRVSETDFVELPSGHLLFVNNSIFAFPGRQIIYRDGDRFTPGPMERAKGNTKPSGLPADSPRNNTVPEAVCLTEEGILIGCMRPGSYHFSDDLGQMWHPLPGTPTPGSVESKQVYQPSMYCLGDGRVACAGHFGHDDPIVHVEGETHFVERHRLHLHLFRVNVHRRMKDTAILVERERGEGLEKWPNAYALTLLCEGQPLPGKELEFWYVERYQPGYDSFGKDSLEDRMAMGGKLLKVSTGTDGKARVELPHLDAVDNLHLSYQFVARFNADGSDLAFKPAQSPQFEPYANCAADEPLDPSANPKSVHERTI